jgi:superfamily II DNA or RNA helicase
MIDDIRFEDLPANWSCFDLEGFSRTKRLWDYQQRAATNAVKVLWKYFQDLHDYKKNEKAEVSGARKSKLFRWYEDNGLEESIDIKVDKRKRSTYSILSPYYQQVNGKIPYQHFINRMCFWMATGSGKTLVIIKLIQIMKNLIDRGEIPDYDFLVLTHRDDLIEQLKKHFDEFNYASGTKILLRELKEYPEVKRQPPLMGITVFYYRSDNLSDEQKERIIDFKNYDDNGKWYVFLDEAHKGDKEESKRQHIYSILSRNGFLFNFSATFVDQRDIATTAFNFNLERFINEGYGKHISILKQEIRAFRDEEDYNNEEKQKIVLKSLIILTYVKKFYGKIVKIRKDLYHNPLMLTLVNSVNVEDADLKLFFRELERIGKGEIGKRIFEEALEDLWKELREEPELMFERSNKIKVDEKCFKEITREDILNHVYNSKTPGDIEVLIRRSNRQELAFKLKTSSKPFALIKIGDISGWLKEELAGYEVQERYEDETYFERLNQEDSDINILMGSRSFYEGWDSNRPNVINYINIGTGEDAKKFILQSTGRGVRIEPLKNKRKRLLPLYNNKEIEEETFNKVKDKILPIETLFIFGTNRNALITVIEELKKEKKAEESQLSLFINKEAQKRKLLIPVYKESETPTLKAQQIKFEITKEDLDTLARFVEFVPDDRVMLMRYEATPQKTRILRENLKEKKNFKTGEKSFRNVDLLIQRIFNYFDVIPEEFDHLKELGEEIKHFRNIKVFLKDISPIEKKIDVMKDYPYKVKELEAGYGKIPPADYSKKNKELDEAGKFEHEHKKISIKYVANHYYIPLILSEDEKVDYITHVIKTPSEIKFVNDLEEYLTREDNKFKEFDWWLFSKIDQTLDEIYIPYYNPNANKISRFYPDFIFWMKKGNQYLIIFVDPKGTEHAAAYRKIDGFRELFEEKDQEKTFSYDSFKVKIRLLLRPEDVAKTLTKYSKYWFDDIPKMIGGMA